MFFRSRGNFFIFKNERSFLLNFWELCAFYHFCFFSKQQNIFDGFANVFINREIVKSKCVWFLFSDEQLAYEIIGFDICRLLAKWFWRWLVFQVNRKYCWQVRTGQTGGVRAVRLASPQSNWPILYQFRFRVVSLDHGSFVFMASRWILCVCNTVVC